MRFDLFDLIVIYLCMITLRKAAFIGALLLVSLAGFWLGVKITTRNSRVVETTRMETCLEIYSGYRSNSDQGLLAKELLEIGFTPKDFQEIIDRFIYYRTRKSSIDQAMKLLQAFRMGYEVAPARIIEVSGFASEPFRLDAEILAVFENNPTLIQNAFEG